MLIKLNVFITLIIYLTWLTNAITIRDEEGDEIKTTTPQIDTKTYRKTIAKVQNSNNRVPEHLQFVRNGFSYDDADDVIHIIEPPKQFEELKRIMQQRRQKPVAIWEQTPKVRHIKPIAKVSLTKRKELENVRNKNLRNVINKQPQVQADLETQETHNLPLEILASVRKTENYLKKFKPKLPLAKQRIKTKKLQTVIWEKSQEQQQFQQGQEQKVQGIREYQQNRRKFIKRPRNKRDADTQYEALPLEYKPLQGEELLNHINELIKNASLYLKLAENYDDYIEDEQAQAKFDTTTLEGEILLTTTKRPATTGLNDDMVVKILENSVKATKVIMQQIKTQNANYSEIATKCDYLKVTYPNHIQNLQNQIKCMQNFIKDINATTAAQKHQQQHHQQQQQHKNKILPSPNNSNKKFGDRLDVRKSKDLSHKPFLIAKLADDYIDDTSPSPVNTSLIYDDVMTTIRNMLQAKNLQNLEDTSTTSLNSWEDSITDSFHPYDNSPEPVDFHNLQQYLTSLQSIVANLPKFNHKSLNLQEIEGTSSKYYFINPQGSIYSLPQPFQKDITPSPSTIFTQFPDIPIVADYIRNGTILPPSKTVVEIL